MRRHLFALALFLTFVMPTMANVLSMHLGNGMDIIYVAKQNISATDLQKRDGKQYVEADNLVFDDIKDMIVSNTLKSTDVGLPKTIELKPGYVYVCTNDISKVYPVDAENVDISVLFQDGYSQIDLSNLPKGLFIVRTGGTPDTYRSFKVQRQPDAITEGSRFVPYWLFGLRGGGTMAFGDDSYHVFKDYKDATGFVVGFNFGRQFNQLLGARLSASYAKLYNRVNLETLEMFGSLYPKYFPRNGFYGYETLSLQAQAMLNFLNIFKYNPTRRFDMYLYAGIGFDNFSNYDRHVGAWAPEAGILPGGWYKVDTGNRIQLSGTIGGSLNYRITKNVRLDLELMGTITQDNMEGVVSEEAYDVYITYMLGLSVLF